MRKSTTPKDFDQKIIGICGNARSGKDTLANNIVEILKEQGIKSKVLSFANELKESVNGFLIEKTGISAFTEDEEQKKLIRPFLVCWGTDIMRSINDNIWIEKLNNNLCSDCVNIITDVRFENEINWIKEMGGLSIFIERDGVNPANKYEEENNKKLSRVVDLRFHTTTFEDPKLIFLTSNEILDKLINIDIYKKWKATCHL
ncbi:MAG: hypothetical protein HWN81_02010 [Candidatus Lokiarchaeota archaeon]|nr:hypothetical protein [Candidatus Lokiarchaeota archaeon]